MLQFKTYTSQSPCFIVTVSWEDKRGRKMKMEWKSAIIIYSADFVNGKIDNNPRNWTESERNMGGLV